MLTPPRNRWPFQAAIAVFAFGCGGAPAASEAVEPAAVAPPGTEGDGASSSPAAPAAPTSSPPPTSAPPVAAPAAPETVLAGRRIQAFALGDTHVFTLESDVQTRLVAIEKAPPHTVKVILEEDILDGVRFEGVGAARGRVFVVDSYGGMKSARPDGTDAKSEYPFGNPNRILPAAETLWLAELPRFLGDTVRFHWFGATTPPNASFQDLLLDPVGAVGDVAVDDEALVYATGGQSTTIRQWAPVTANTARAGHKLLATLPEQARTIGLDATRVVAHLVAAKEIRAIDRDTGASTTVLAATSFDTPPMLRSDGTSLYMLTQTALRRCTIASCASSMTVLASGLAGARIVALDATHAYIVTAGENLPSTILRVPK